MTPERIAEIRRRCEKATQKPVKYWLGAIIKSPYKNEKYKQPWCALGPPTSEYKAKMDSEVFEAMRTDIPALCDEVDRLRAQLRAAIKKLKPIMYVEGPGEMDATEVIKRMSSVVRDAVRILEGNNER